MVWNNAVKLRRATSHFHEKSIKVANTIRCVFRSDWGGHSVCTAPIKPRYKTSYTHSTRGQKTVDTSPIADRSLWNGLAAFTTAIQFPCGLYNVLHHTLVCMVVRYQSAEGRTGSRYGIHGLQTSTHPLLPKYHSNKPSHKMM